MYLTTERLLHFVFQILHLWQFKRLSIEMAYKVYLYGYLYTN